VRNEAGKAVNLFLARVASFEDCHMDPSLRLFVDSRPADPIGDSQRYPTSSFNVPVL